MTRRTTTLFFAPTKQYVEAHIVDLTPDLAEQRLHNEWWADEGLLDHFEPPPIDRDWDWNEMAIENEGRKLSDKKFALTTGDGAVQGAMMISDEPIPSRLSKRADAVFLELLFTAPRNRPALRRDGQPFYVGVGTHLLAWAAWLSREGGFGGRLLLDASPDFIGWYIKRGLQTLEVAPIVFEGVTYTPMELPPRAAQRLLKELSSE